MTGAEVVGPFPFDVEAAFGEDYLYFASAVFDDERSDADTASLLSLACLEPGARVLDAPCGAGRIAVRLAAQGFDVTGVDRSAGYLAHAAAAAAARGVDVELLEGDLRSIPATGPFDAVVCWHTSFGYFDDGGNRAVLAEFRRVLSPGGVLVIETLSHDGYVRGFTESPEAIVTELGEDLMVDRNTFDPATGCVVTRRVTIRDGVRGDARFFIRLPTIPEWHAWLAEAGFGSVEVTDLAGDDVELSTWRIAVRATA